MGFLVATVLILVNCAYRVESKAQFVQPLAFGMNLNIGYDIANIFQRPIAATTGVVLSVALALILFFGVITSPFGYFFGVPSRKYVLGGAAAPRSVDSDSYSYPDFEQSLLSLISPEEDEACLDLILCIAHGIVKKLPKEWLRVYRFFSKDLFGASAKQSEAILLGLKEKSLCEEKYCECETPIFTIVVRSIANLMPKKFVEKKERIVY